uniref:ethanolamine kinase n=1 Tax=Oncorhynchus tshawytscha TaxID=74940 RepID=A0A8C8CP43_ONCTS
MACRVTRHNDWTNRGQGSTRNDSLSAHHRQLLHLDVCVDEKEPHSGVLEIISRLRFQWKPQAIQRKVSEWMRGIMTNLSWRISMSVFLFPCRLIATEMGKILSIKFKSDNHISHRNPERVPIESLKDEMETLKRHLSLIGSTTVFCHNDLLTKNIIYDYKEGNHFNEFAGIDYSLYPSPELQRDWLTAYLESYKHSVGYFLQTARRDIHELICVSNFFWGLWAILQARDSSIDFNFER